MHHYDRTLAGAASAGSRRSAYLWWLIWILWLPLFVPQVIALLQAHPAPVRLVISLVGAALFFTLYLSTTWQCAHFLASASPRVVPTKMALWTPIAVMLALAMGLTLLNGPVWGGLFIYTSACVGGWLPLRQAVAVIAGMVLFTLVGLGPQVGFAATLSPITFIILPGLTVIVSVRSVTTIQQLRAAREEMAGLAAVTEERLRIARDLHDLLGHSLSLIALKSELARRLVTVAPERAAAEIGDVESVARTALQEVREAVAGYRQPTLVSELLAAREILAAAGIDATVDGDDSLTGSIPAAAEAVLSWTVREGVTNVIRHSRARHCRISVTREAGRAGIEVTDDGSDTGAFPLDHLATEDTAGDTGSGLAALAERVHALGGQVAAGPQPAGGFQMAVWVPITSGGPPPHADAAPDAPSSTPLSEATPTARTTTAPRGGVHESDVLA